MKLQARKIALLVAGFVLGAQLMGAFHSHEAHAATEEEPCSACQLSQELRTVEPETTEVGHTLPVRSFNGIDSIDFILPQEVPTDAIPRGPPAYL